MGGSARGLVLLSALNIGLKMIGASSASSASSPSNPPDRDSNKYAVLIAGSAAYYNYRHQADVAAAFHQLKLHGVPESHIITFLNDDIVNSTWNPFPGQLFNRPSPAGEAGDDVYKGLKISYRGENVTAENFLNVLKGNRSDSSLLPEVLQSNEDSHVFVYYSDHGGTGLVGMPHGDYLYADQLMEALRYMYDNKMYKKLVFYLEACEAGSMFANLTSTTDLPVFAVTASNAEESSWGTFCPPDDVVNGTSVGACLGDLFSVNFIDDINTRADLRRESLLHQYSVVKQETNMSHVTAFGDHSFDLWPVANFFGSKSKREPGTGTRTNIGTGLEASGDEQQQQEQQQQVARKLPVESQKKRPRAKESSCMDARVASEHTMKYWLSKMQNELGPEHEKVQQLLDELLEDQRRTATQMFAFRHAEKKVGDVHRALARQQETVQRIAGDDDHEKPKARGDTNSTGTPDTGTDNKRDDDETEPFIITRWDCYRRAVSHFETHCGRTTDAAMARLGSLARLCEKSSGTGAGAGAGAGTGLGGVNMGVDVILEAIEEGCRAAATYN